MFICTCLGVCVGALYLCACLSVNLCLFVCMFVYLSTNRTEEYPMKTLTSHPLEYPMKTLTSHPLEYPMKTLTSHPLCLCSVRLSVSVCGIDSYLNALHVLHLAVGSSCLSVLPPSECTLLQLVLPLMLKMLATMDVSIPKP